MDAKISTHSAWLWSLALAFLVCSAAATTADEVIASDSEEASSAIFVSDDSIREDSVNEPVALPQSAVGSVVFIEDTPSQDPVSRKTINRATVASLPAPRTTARGELRVVANQQQPVAWNNNRSLANDRPMSNQAPIAQQPTMASEFATVEHVSAPYEREQLGDIQIAVHAEPVALEPVALEIAASATRVPSVAGLLIRAHQHTQGAKTTSDYSQIIQDCDEAIDLGATGEQRSFARQLSSWALNRRGQLRLDEDQQDLAGADFQAALDYNSRNWRAMHNRGVMFAQSRQFAEAFDDFNRVIQLNPKHAKAYANRATLYVQAKDLQAAAKDYELAIERDEQFATAYVGLGRIYHMLGRWDDAIEFFTTAVQLEPTSADVICSRGDLHADMGHYGEALADYARTIEIDSEFAHAYRNGAWLLATCPDKRFRDPENAILGAQQALECSYGEQHIALDTLAAAFASDGQFEEAIAMVTQAVDMAPEDAKFSYLTRLQLYQSSEPYRTDPVSEVSQATYETGVR